MVTRTSSALGAAKGRVRSRWIRAERGRPLDGAAVGDSELRPDQRREQVGDAARLAANTKEHPRSRCMTRSSGGHRHPPLRNDPRPPLGEVPTLGYLVMSQHTPPLELHVKTYGGWDGSAGA